MSSSLTPKKNLENELVAETRELVSSIRRNFILIAANLYRIHDTWTGTADSWVEFYQEDLLLDKSTVSKLLKVGEFVLANGFLKSTVPYQKLYLSINANKGEDPKLVMARAETWNDADFREQDREDCTHSKPSISVCPDCFKKL